MCMLYYLNTLANIIINTYLNNSHCLIIISQNDLEYKGDSVYIYFKFYDNNILENILETLNMGCQDYVIQTDNPVTIINAMEQFMKLQVQRFTYRKYLILPTENSVDLDVVPSIPAFQFVPDILVAVPEVNFNVTTNYSQTFSSDECEVTFKLISHKFVGRYNNDEVVVMDYWYPRNMSFKYNNNLYPDKISNVQGRLIKMATFTYYPYTIVGDTLAESDGTEMRVGLEYAKKHNFTVELVVDQVNEWGEIYDNWTGNGILGNVAMDNADIGFGALYTWYHEFGFLDLSLPLVRTGITCLAPAPGLLDSWFAPFFPFDLTLWIAVLISFIVSHISYIIILYLTVLQEKRENKEEMTGIGDQFIIFLLIFRIYLLQSWPAVRAIEKSTIRYLLTTVLVLSLLISTCYNSGLATSMTLPRYQKAIKTVQDLADSNIDWGATHNAWIFSILNADQPTIIKIVHNFKLLSEAQLRARTTTKDYAFSLERLPAGHYAIGGYITEDIVPNLKLMSEDIYWEQCVIMSRKSSPFMPSLNNLVLRIHETGLPASWESQVALKYLDYQVQLKVKILSQQKHPDQDPIVLSMRHVQGTFALFIGGIIISILGLIVEIIVFNYTKIKDEVIHFE